MSILEKFKNNKSLTAYLLLSAACLFWAGNFVMGRAVVEVVPPIALSFTRWLLASLLILPLAWPHLKRDWPVISKSLGFYALLGLLGGATYNALTYLALHTTTANNAFILNAAIALMIVIANAIIQKIRPTATQLIAIAIAMLGMVYIITEGHLANLAEFQFKTGDILVIITMVSWALYTALLPNRPKSHSISFAALTYIAATLWLFPAFIIEQLFFQQFEVNSTAIASILYAGIFPGLLAYLFYNKGVELIGGNRAGITTYLIPLFGAVLSYLFLREVPESHHYIGFALIISGVLLSALYKPSSQKGPPPKPEVTLSTSDK